MVSPPEPVVRIAGAVKHYGERKALDGLDLELEAGRWTGLIGPNGAGKTTTMLSLMGLIPLDEGRIEVLGETVDEPRPEVSWVPQNIALYEQLSGRENLEIFGALHGLKGSKLREQVAWALDWIGLENRADDRLGTWSGGMQRRLNIACAVLHRPRILLLDEPTVGVDPQARLRLFTMLEALRDEGVALLHSSHELDDIEDACDTLAILDRGRTVATGTVGELVGSLVGHQAQLTLELEGEPVPGLESASDGRFTARLGDAAAELRELLAAVEAKGGRIGQLELRRPGLREVFLELTGKDLRE